MIAKCKKPIASFLIQVECHTIVLESNGPGARVLYNAFGKNFGFSLALERYGMIGQTLRFRAADRLALASYPLSVMTARGVISGPLSSKLSNCRLSLASPPVN